MHENWYDRHVLPYFLDCACGLEAVSEQRQKVVPHARGRVLEIGIGTGRNMQHYNKGAVEKIVGVDPALAMHRLAQKRVARAGLKVELVGLAAEKLPLESASFDSIVMTYTLCSIPDPAAALAEMRRVLAPGGRLLFCEHGRAPEESVRRWQDRLQPLWGRISGGCQLGRDIPALLRGAGFDLKLDSGYIKGPRPMTYNYWGQGVVHG